MTHAAPNQTVASPADDAPSRPMLEGTLERVTYHNEENGYTVARLTPRGKRHVVTVVGRMLGVNVGASLKLWGRWTSHAQYGRQFEVEDYAEQLPATIEGIRKYLGSGLIHGVGPVTADRIVDQFGLETLDVIDETPERLSEVPGVGPVRARQIRQAWAEQQQIKDIMLFLQAHDVSTSLAVRIFKHYGGDATAVVRDDPYRLARDVFGIGFRTADRIARKMGLAPDSPQRVEAGLLFALEELAGDGHVYAPRDALVREAVALLELEDGADVTALADAAVGRLVEAEALIRSEIPIDHAQPAADAGATIEAIYLPPFFFAEGGVAGGVRRLLEAKEDRLACFDDTDWPAVFDYLDRNSPYPLAERQREAVRAALTAKVTVLTGGPGTGKTTTVRTVLRLLAARGKSFVLAAPTGRAAKRLAETTGGEAKTIHRLLEFKPSEGMQFARNAQHPLDADMIVIDEVSMVDVFLMNHLLKAVAAGSHLLLVGDRDQLPSVGAGSVLADLIASGVVPTIALDQIFRQADDSYIVVNAHRINRGKMPVFPPDSTDFFLFGVEDAEAAAERLVDVVANRIPRTFGYHPVDDIQVLSPMHRGPAGVGALNERLQAALNPPGPSKPEVSFGRNVFRLGDKVMQIRNNYDKDVYNGDLGRVVDIDRAAKELRVAFEGRPVSYELNQLDELVLAFACSTHKSQGAEYPAVVMALLPGHYMLLQRNLLYTGVTRARELCVLVGSKRAIGMAVRNDRVAARNTDLARRLRERVGG